METLAPPVVAVIVARDPGSWFEQTLAALAAQDYPELSVLVLDTGSDPELSARVAAVVPGAFVRRLPAGTGYAAACNEAMGMVEGASHYLFCHDDVAPDPDAVRLLVEESFRSNAAVTAPKLVCWDDPRRLLHVGMSVDKGGAVVDRVEPGEIDQGQHDVGQEVFLAPGGCLLVRADLFAELGGFDAGIVAMGEDLDLCWRARAAGARVVVAAAARARHRETLAAGSAPLPVAAPGSDMPSAPSLQALQRRHELRAVLGNYSRMHLLRVLPQLLVLSLAEMVVALVAGHPERAEAVAHAYRWNLRHRRELLAKRRQLAGCRRVADREVRHLQLRGSARLAAYARRAVAYGLSSAHLDPELLHRQATATAGPAGAGPAGAGTAGAGTADAGSVGAGSVGAGATGAPSLLVRVVVWVAVVGVLVVGSRQVIGGHLPVVGQLMPFPSAGTMLSRFVSSWQPGGFGVGAPGSPGLALLGLLGSLLFGAVGLLQKVLVLGCLPVGALGVSRLAKMAGSWWARAAAVVLYLAVPLPFDALALGRWDGLLAYGVAPWFVLVLARAGGLAPLRSGRRIDAPGLPPAVSGRWWAGLWRPALGSGIAVGIVTSWAPTTWMVVPVVAVGLAIGSALSHERGWGRQVVRLLAVAAMAVAVAVAVSMPWSLWVLGGGARWSLLGGLRVAPATGAPWSALLRLAVGPVGDSALAFGLVVAAAIPLVIGTGWRHTWAVRGWSLASTAWLVAWAGGRGWLGGITPPAHVLLAPAAVGLVLSAAMGVLAIERDLRGFRFGWRQAVAGLGVLSLAVTVVPVVGSAGGGRWALPPSGYQQAVAWMAHRPAAEDARVLWVGDPRWVPAAGWSLPGGEAMQISAAGVPDVTGLTAGASARSVAAVAHALELARDGGTVQLGSLLAPYGIRYLVLVTSLAPSYPGYRPADAGAAGRHLAAALAHQLDLRAVPGQGGFAVYDNLAALPVRAWRAATASVPTAGVGTGSTGSTAGVGTGSTGSTAGASTGSSRLPSGWQAVLPGSVDSGVGRGPLRPGEVLVAQGPPGGWELVDAQGRPVPSSTAFGYATRFTVTAAGVYTLRQRGSWLHSLAIVGELVLWLVALGLLAGGDRWLRRLRRPALAASSGSTAAADTPPAASSGSAAGADTPPAAAEAATAGARDARP